MFKDPASSRKHKFLYINDQCQVCRSLFECGSLAEGTDHPRSSVSLPRKMHLSLPTSVFIVLCILLALTYDGNDILGRTRTTCINGTSSTSGILSLKTIIVSGALAGELSISRQITR